MNIFSALQIVCAVTLLSYAHGFVVHHPSNIPPITQAQSSTNLTIGPNTHCTQDPSWLATGSDDIAKYRLDCQNAINYAWEELGQHGMTTEFEFLARGAPAQTTKPKIQLPRKYTACMYHNSADLPSPLFFGLVSTLTMRRTARRDPEFPPCTIAIAMIGSLSAGAPLPGNPAGPFGSSDVSTMQQLIWGGADPLSSVYQRCIWNQDASMGWTRTGTFHVMAFDFLQSLRSVGTAVPVI